MDDLNSTDSRELRQGVGSDRMKFSWCQIQAQARGKPALSMARDTKAFTGRGGKRELRHWIDSLARIEQQMLNLSEAVKKSSSSLTAGAYLAVHRRNAAAAVQLRWRARGLPARHLLYQDVAVMIAGQPELILWAQEITHLADRLNVSHDQARKQVRLLQGKRIKRRAPPLWPKPIG